jgi:hypothetical protein
LRVVKKWDGSGTDWDGSPGASQINPKIALSRSYKADFPTGTDNPKPLVLLRNTEHYTGSQKGSV